MRYVVKAASPFHQSTAEIIIIFLLFDFFPTLFRLPASWKPYKVKTKGRLCGKSPTKQTTWNKRFPSATMTKAETLIQLDKCIVV